MNTKNKPPIIPINLFTEAALAYFKCHPKEVEISMISEKKEAFVIHNGEGYKISTRGVLREEIAIQLSDKQAALDINLNCWIQATKNTVKINRFLSSLIRTIEGTEQAEKLHIAVGLGSYTDDIEVAFWEILSRIDKDGDLLGTAMAIVAEVYNGPGLIDDLTEIQIIYGSQVYNKIVGGIFEAIYVDDDIEFFIYSVDEILE